MSALLILAAAFVAAQPSPSPAAECPVDRLGGASLEQTQAAWLERFNALDLPCFLRFFAADATLFSPSPQDETARRVEPAGIADYWTKMFGRLGEGGRKPSITPQGVTVTSLGPTAAVVSFHLSADAYPNRRTLVWRRDPAGWRIVHLHASRLPPPAAK